MHTLYLYRNEEEQKTIAEVAERQQNINLCRGLQNAQPVHHRKQYGNKDKKFYKRKPYAAKSCEAKPYAARAKTESNIKVEISVDSEEQQESSVSSLTSMSTPFCGEKNIEKCYNRYIAYNSAEELLRDDKLY